MLTMAVIGFTAPFWHIFYGVNDNEGLFGYTYMSSFLFAIGNRICLLVFSLLFIMALKHIEGPFKNFFRNVAYMGLFVSCFFLVQILISKRVLMNAFGVADLHRSFYYVAMAVMAICSGMLATLFQKALMLSEEKLKTVIRRLFDFIIIDSEPDISPFRSELHSDKVDCLINEVGDYV